jgi:hypothetical protein
MVNGKGNGSLKIVAIKTGAADLKFPHQARQTPAGTSNRKAALVV